MSPNLPAPYSAPEDALLIGVMTGTSTDAIDVVVADFTESTPSPSGPWPKVLAHASIPFDPDLRQALLQLQGLGVAADDPILHEQQVCLSFSKACADAINQTLSTLAPGLRSRVFACGVHGQTLRHRPEIGITHQMLNPAVIAEHTGLHVVSDFRRRDVAAGGQGAPLVPAFHAACLAHSGLEQAVVLNIGGFSNVTVCGPLGVFGSDCGPGGALMDAWVQLHQGVPFDEQGQWARRGRIHDGLFQLMKAHPFFARPFPKSTGRDEFHLDWLNGLLSQLPRIEPTDVQATLSALTVEGIATAIQSLSAVAGVNQHSLPLAAMGGGAYNAFLMESLLARAQQSDIGVHLVQTDLGIAPQTMEALAFAWLARQCLMGLGGNVPKVTGAHGVRILGSITPGG